MTGETPFEEIGYLHNLWAGRLYDRYTDAIDAGHGEQVAAAFEAEAERLEAMT